MTKEGSTLAADTSRGMMGKPNEKHLDGSRLPSADTIEGREISTAWPIIWSNGGPSVRNKSPRLFCISSSDDWPTFVPRRWSQLKVPSVKQHSLPDAEPRWGIHTLTLTHQFTVMGVVFFCIYFLSFVFLFSPFKAPCQASKSNFILPVLSRSVYTISYCLVSSGVSKFSIYTEYFWKYAMFGVFKI